jgi:type IV pilus assembly protein PilM
MIRNIFIPEKIGSYYLFSKHIVGIDIGLTEIYATVVIASGHSRTIERLIEERVETEGTATHQERVIKALQSLHGKLGTYEALYAALPSSLVVFKELTLPFVGLRKIKLVAPFEVESLLPFTLDQAVIDVIVTKEDKVTKQSDVMVAAVKREYLSEYTDLFEAAGMSLDKVSVDMFELYGFYSSIPSYHKTSRTVALIDLGFYATRIALVTDNQLKYIRSIPKGLVTVAKKISTSNGTDTAENLEHIMRFGAADTEDSTSNAKLKEALDELLQEVNLTILSYTRKLKPTEQLESVIITGAAGDIPGIVELVQVTMGVKTEILQARKMVHNGQIHSKVKTIPNSFLVSIATALSSPLTEEFNLQQAKAQEKEDVTLGYQIITLIALAGLILGGFSLYSFFRLRNLRIAYRNSEAEAITDLKKVFKLKPNQTATLEAANKAASGELRKQETTWQRLSSENRYSFLRYLTELSKCIDVKESQLNLTSVSIKDDSIKIYGSVPGYDQLTKLQHQLECPLFKKIPKLQDLNFKSEPITLTINKEQET